MTHHSAAAVLDTTGFPVSSSSSWNIGDRAPASLNEQAIDIRMLAK